MPEESRKATLIKKIILIAVLISVLIFCFINIDSIKDGKKSFTFKDHETVVTENIPIDGSHVIEQPVIMESNSIGKIGVLFNNPDKNNARGQVSVSLLDEKGNKVGETQLDASFIRENRYTNFLIGGDSEATNTNRIAEETSEGSRTGTTKVDKGKKYTLRIELKDFTNDTRPELVLCRDSSKAGTYDVVIDGKKLDDTCLYMYTSIQVYSPKTLGLIIALILITLVFVLLPFRLIDEKVSSVLGRPEFSMSTLITRVMFIMTPLVAYFVIQKYQDYNANMFIGQIMDTNGKGLLNLLIIGLLWWLIYTICNRVNITSVVTVAIASLFGLTNYILILFRDSPLVATDFGQFGTAMQVVESYTLSFNKAFLWSVLLTVLWCVAALAPPGHKGLTPKKRFIPLAVLLVWCGVFYYTFFTSTYIEDHGIKISSFKPKKTYADNGGALSFVLTAKNSVVKKPEDYSPENVAEITKNYRSDQAAKATEVSRKTPNIIIVMNESFSDMKAVGDFKTNEDYIPFYRSLKENTVKGLMDSSVYGGSTANSEFESLTGFSMRYLPFMSVPFRSIIKEETPSLVYDLKSMGYGGNIAFHPGMRNSYNRENVYPLLGFDKHVASEDLNDPVKIRDYVSDQYDYEYIEKEFEEHRKASDDPFFTFNVTIQNHGGYDIGTGLVEGGIEITSPDNREESAQQFLNLMKLSDEALEGLIEYFSEVDEETVILFFGDHQPRLGSTFYDSLKAQHKDISDLEWEDLKHLVPFMIWANFHIDSEDDLLMSANYLSPYMKKTIGLPMTGFDKYLMGLYDDLPVVNSICYKDKEGKLFDITSSSEYDKQLNEYAMIQYNGLIDSENRLDDFFSLKIR